MKTKDKKLSLRKETVKELSAADLQGANGASLSIYGYGVVAPPPPPPTFYTNGYFFYRY